MTTLEQTTCKPLCDYRWILAFIILALILSACNPIKQVLADPKKKEKVGREWAKTNPCINDTAVIFKSGKPDSTKDNINQEYINFLDSLNGEFNLVKDSINKQELDKYQKTVDSLLRNPQILRTIIRFRDTIKLSIKDTRSERILADSVDYYHGTTVYYQGTSDEAIKAKNDAIDDLHKAKVKNTFQLIIFILLIVAFLAAKFYFKVPFL